MWEKIHDPQIFIAYSHVFFLGHHLFMVEEHYSKFNGLIGLTWGRFDLSIFNICEYGLCNWTYALWKNGGSTQQYRGFCEVSYQVFLLTEVVLCFTQQKMGSLYDRSSTKELLPPGMKTDSAEFELFRRLNQTASAKTDRRMKI